MLLYIPRPGGGYFFARRLFRRGGKSGIADIPQPKTPRRAQRFGRLPGGAGRLRRGGGVRPHCIYLLRLRRGFSAAKFFCPQAFPPGREKRNCGYSSAENAPPCSTVRAFAGRSGATPPGRRGAPALYIFAPSAAGLQLRQNFFARRLFRRGGNTQTP